MAASASVPKPTAAPTIVVATSSTPGSSDETKSSLAADQQMVAHLAECNDWNDQIIKHHKRDYEARMKSMVQTELLDVVVRYLKTLSAKDQLRIAGITIRQNNLLGKNLAAHMMQKLKEIFKYEEPDFDQIYKNQGRDNMYQWNVQQEEEAQFKVVERHRINFEHLNLLLENIGNSPLDENKKASLRYFEQLITQNNCSRSLRPVRFKFHSTSGESLEPLLPVLTALKLATAISDFNKAVDLHERLMVRRLTLAGIPTVEHAVAYINNASVNEFIRRAKEEIVDDRARLQTLEQKLSEYSDYSKRIAQCENFYFGKHQKFYGDNFVAVGRNPEHIAIMIAPLQDEIIRLRILLRLPLKQQEERKEQHYNDRYVKSVKKMVERDQTIRSLEEKIIAHYRKPTDCKGESVDALKEQLFEIYLGQSRKSAIEQAAQMRDENELKTFIETAKLSALTIRCAGYQIWQNDIQSRLAAWKKQQEERVCYTNDPDEIKLAKDLAACAVFPKELDVSTGISQLNRAIHELSHHVYLADKQSDYYQLWQVFASINEMLAKVKKTLHEEISEKFCKYSAESKATGEKLLKEKFQKDAKGQSVQVITCHTFSEAALLAVLVKKYAVICELEEQLVRDPQRICSPFLLAQLLLKFQKALGRPLAKNYVLPVYAPPQPSVASVAVVIQQEAKETCDIILAQDDEGFTLFKTTSKDALAAIKKAFAGDVGVLLHKYDEKSHDTQHDSSEQKEQKQAEDLGRDLEKKLIESEQKKDDLNYAKWSQYLLMLYGYSIGGIYQSYSLSLSKEVLTQWFASLTGIINRLLTWQPRSACLVKLKYKHYSEMWAEREYTDRMSNSSDDKQTSFVVVEEKTASRSWQRVHAKFFRATLKVMEADEQITALEGQLTENFVAMRDTLGRLKPIMQNTYTVWVEDEYVDALAKTPSDIRDRYVSHPSYQKMTAVEQKFVNDTLNAYAPIEKKIRELYQKLFSAVFIRERRLFNRLHDTLSIYTCGPFKDFMDCLQNDIDESQRASEKDPKSQKYLLQKAKLQYAMDPSVNGFVAEHHEEFKKNKNYKRLWEVVDELRKMFAANVIALQKQIRAELSDVFLNHSEADFFQMLLYSPRLWGFRFTLNKDVNRLSFKMKLKIYTIIRNFNDIFAKIRYADYQSVHNHFLRFVNLFEKDEISSDFTHGWWGAVTQAEEEKIAQENDSSKVAVTLKQLLVTCQPPTGAGGDQKLFPAASQDYVGFIEARIAKVRDLLPKPKPAPSPEAAAAPSSSPTARSDGK